MCVCDRLDPVSYMGSQSPWNDTHLNLIFDVRSLAEAARAVDVGMVPEKQRNTCNSGLHGVRLARWGLAWNTHQLQEAMLIQHMAWTQRPAESLTIGKYSAIEAPQPGRAMTLVPNLCKAQRLRPLPYLQLVNKYTVHPVSNTPLMMGLAA